LAHYCRPVSIEILMTKRCHARCVHCDIWKLRGHEDTLSPDQWKRLLTELRSWLGPVHVVLTGGEALLKPYTTEVAAHGSAIGLFVEVLTNGYWANQARIESLALARPGRITVSMDGVGAAHSLVRGRDDFFEVVDASLRKLVRLRDEKHLPYEILLKTVIMSHNLGDAAGVAKYARSLGASVLYQPIEQNYETPDDPTWYEHSSNWPQDTEAAVAVVNELRALKAQGYPIDNHTASLESMIRYFRDPGGLSLAVQSHVGHERQPACSATTNLQIEPNGDVVTCWRKPPIGNIRETDIRQLWRSRPRWWRAGCCLTSADA
jgi:MoaA/NifB/PqqE/SkfB family radical SAM enzyme